MVYYPSRQRILPWTVSRFGEGMIKSSVFDKTRKCAEYKSGFPVGIWKYGPRADKEGSPNTFMIILKPSEVINNFENSMKKIFKEKMCTYFFFPQTS